MAPIKTGAFNQSGTGAAQGRVDHPLVSIVIPVYNCESYLGEAIDSVLSQDYPHVELIVLDDGSTDASKSVIEGYPESSFYRASHANMGQAATLNKGWEMARGDILSYLSADDALLPGAISKAVEQLKANPAMVMVYGDYQLMDAKSRPTEHVAAPDFDYREMVCDIVVQPGPGIFFHRICFERLGGWDVSLHQTPDYEYWLRLALMGPFLHVPVEMARFRVHEASQSFHSTTVEKSDEVIHVLERYFERNDLPPGISLLMAQAISMAFVVAARFHLRAGRDRLFWKRLGSAIGCYPLVIFRPRTLRLLLNALKHRLETR